MKRPAQPALSDAGEAALAPYVSHLHDEQDLSAATRRNYLSDLRQFAAWCEHSWAEGQDELRALCADGDQHADDHHLPLLPADRRWLAAGIH
ncbi:MAG: site-specific integrase [Chloroflexi bacterium]|nr:site-specific integrase [Chloroflexota bacterium]